MATFIKASKPALNKEGYAKVTYTGFETGVSAKADEKTGELKPYIKLLFTAMDTTRRSPIAVNVLGNARLTESNAITKTLVAMGYREVSELTLDDDGFEVELTEEDSEGFELESTDDNDEVESFLSERVGKVYLCKLVKNKKGFLELAVDTLKLL